jgi:uncharacterized protein YfaT (DUF1175 family)
MPDVNLIYRDQMVRAVLGTGPAILAKEADIAALARFAQRLADAEETIQLLCANGYGIPSQSLPDLVRGALGIKP